jgi:hypothetical protein
MSVEVVHSTDAVAEGIKVVQPQMRVGVGQGLSVDRRPYPFHSAIEPPKRTGRLAAAEALPNPRIGDAVALL